MTAGSMTAGGMTAAEIIRAGQAQPARPWPRYAISSQAWRTMAQALGGSAELRFEALWADAAQVFALFTRPEPVLVSAPVEAGVYAALSPARPDAALFERMIGDLWGHLAASAVDARPWLDHGFWPVVRPMLARPIPNSGTPEPTELRAMPEGVSAYRLGPVQSGPLQSGPLGSGLAGPALLAVAARGERLVQVEARLGYAHRGVLAAMRGRTPAEAAVLAARIAGEGTVSHSLAFARAAEAALGAEPPPRAIALRGVLAGLERMALHLLDHGRALAAVGWDAAGSLEQRERLLRAAQLAFGHRLLMGVVVPGGLARDIAPEGGATLVAALDALETPPVIGPSLARRLGASLGPMAAALAESAAAAAAVRARLGSLPEGAFASVVPAASGEGLGRADGARGVCWHWLQVRDGRVTEAFVRDPAWVSWPRFERAAPGRALADLELLAAASGLTVAGMDL
ncbi:MAG: hypothetical protein NVSMB18_23420 [Acetobacteraceae bacterium]